MRGNDLPDFETNLSLTDGWKDGRTVVTLQRGVYHDFFQQYKATVLQLATRLITVVLVVCWMFLAQRFLRHLCIGGRRRSSQSWRERDLCHVEVGV